MTKPMDARSEKNLIGVNPVLVDICRTANDLLPEKYKFVVIEGVRTPERQAELYAQGRTKPGDIVTWTLNSRHFKDPVTGYGHAVDLLPKTGWNDVAGFNAVNNAMMAAAAAYGKRIRWGADWDMDGNPREKGETDSPHWELA